jgi:hypothetical protein
MPLGTDFASAHSRASLAALAAFLITSGGGAQIAVAPDAATLAKFVANKNRISAFSMELLKAPSPPLPFNTTLRLTRRKPDNDRIIRYVWTNSINF